MSDSGVAEGHTAKPKSVEPRARLVRKYALLISVLVSGVLIVGGAVELYFSYQETKLTLLRIQKQKAVSAAAVIGQFVEDLSADLTRFTSLRVLSSQSSFALNQTDRRVADVANDWDLQ